jgi:hypothetical protein
MKNWIFDDPFHKNGPVLREYGSSGEDVSVNAVIIPNCSPILIDTSDPELLYSHCWQVKTRIFNLVKNYVLVFWGVFNTKIEF